LFENVVKMRIRRLRIAQRNADRAAAWQERLENATMFDDEPIVERESGAWVPTVIDVRLDRIRTETEEEAAETLDGSEDDKEATVEAADDEARIQEVMRFGDIRPWRQRYRAMYQGTATTRGGGTAGTGGTQRDVAVLIWNNFGVTWRESIMHHTPEEMAVLDQEADDDDEVQEEKQELSDLD
jgi:hypothetical protein